ncbi:UNVERIFIED_CONTAM: hypothetical protein GTU68_058030, partial [Idotea baltica]|nr:hypothetical protein [Idotea baltica]
MYTNYKTHGYWGVYEWLNPALVISDLDLIRDVMVKDFDHFTDRRSMKFNGKEEIFNEMLTMVQGDEWKSLRTIMSPTFSSGKIKAMFPLIVEKSNDLVKQCEMEMVKKSYVQIYSLLGYYTMDVIATCAFGIDDHCLEIRESSDFIKNAQKMTRFNFQTLVKITVLTVAPKLFKLLGLQLNEEAEAYLIKVVEETVSARKKTGMKRGDFIDLLLEALEVSKSKERKNDYPMSMNTIIVESVLFILAGFDTTSNSLSFMVFFLAKYQEEQKKIRKELLKLIEVDGEVTYQNIMEAKYLEAFISGKLK